MQACAAHIGRLRLAVLHIAPQLAGIEVGAPDQALARSTHHHIMQRAPLRGHRAGAQGQHVGQVVLQRAGRVFSALRRGVGQQGLPGIHVHIAQLHIGSHAPPRGRRPYLLAHPQRDGAVDHLGGTAHPVAQVVHRAHAFHAQRQAVLQGHGRAVGRRHKRGACDLVLKAHRQGRIGRLAQGRGQRQRHALQAGADLQFGHAPAQSKHHAVGCGARGLLGQLRQHAQLARLAQPLSAGRALGAQLQQGRLQRRRACRGRAHAAFQAHIAPQRAGLHARQGKACFAELHRAARARQGRGVRGDAQVVARQRERALHARMAHFADRQLQLQAQVGGAAALGIVQGMAGHG